MRTLGPWLALLAFFSGELSARAAADDLGEAPRLRRFDRELRLAERPLRDVSRWPAEPPSPRTVDPPAFRRAMADLCPRLAPGEVTDLADALLAAAAAEQVDPFLVGGLVHESSRCDRKLAKPFGIGLLQIQDAMVRPALRDGGLVYEVRGEGGALVEKRRALPPDPMSRRNLLRVPHNLRVGSALLGMWQDQHALVDERFPGVPHRTALAHFFWGDRVGGESSEDRALAARRRMLESYACKVPASVAVPHLETRLLSPLDGAPRLGISGPGEDREGGVRTHRGLDIDAAQGEPVRAVAPGVVAFAGADLPGAAPAAKLTPREARAIRRRFGPGGLFVCVEHDPRLATCYFHVSSYSVAAGDRVEAGQVIARVGRTGVRHSITHLHFEVHIDGRAVDPARVLGALVIPPRETVGRQLAVRHRRARLARQRTEAHAAVAPATPGS